MWKQRKIDKEKEQILIQNGKHPIIARLLAQRNISLENVDKFIKADYNNLSHPHLLHDLEKGVDIFIDVAKNKGKVSVIGDFDSDGVLSSVMVKELCNVFGLDCKVFIPSRLDHGYGLNEKTIKAFSETFTEPPDLLIITDCGMNSKKEVEELRAMGIKKIIIIDHHMGVEGSVATNADALITWHLSNGLNEMCACGEVFQFIRGIRWKTKRVDPIEFLSYAAIGTIADVSPIIGDNRIIVKNGLTEYALNHVNAVGLYALLKQSKIHITALTQEDVSFKMAPRINAVGRISSADIAFDLLVEREPETAKKMAEYITTYNDERKTKQKKIEIEAKAIADKNKYSDGILVCSKDWHIGIVGIVASKIVATYNCPALVIGYNDGVWKGSGRSINGINLKEILDSCSEMFKGYGGHAMACGVALKDKYVDKASAMFNKACKKYLEKHELDPDPDNFFDAKLKPKAITPKICKILIDQLYPYCNVNNAEPLFKLSGVNIIDVKFIEKDTWKLLKFRVEKDGVDIPHYFKTFSPPCGAEVEGRKADIIFSFPQKTKDPSNYFFAFELNVADITLL